MSGEISLLADEVASRFIYLTSGLPPIAHVLRDDVDVEGRTIYIAGEMEEECGAWFQKVLRFLERAGSDPVTVWINSPGGDVTSEFAIHDAIRSSSCEVVTVGAGEVASAAGLVLACGHRRYVTESTVFMAHEPRGYGDAELGLRAAKDRRKWEDWQHDYWAELMGRYTTGDAAFWKRVTSKGGEYWLLGGAAIVEAKLADGLYPPRGAGAPRVDR